MLDNIRIRKCETKDYICLSYRYSEILSAQIDVSCIDGFWYIHRIIVPPAIRSQGIGSALISSLLEWADRKQRILVLEISGYGSMTNDQLDQWYKRFGFTDYYIEKRFPALIRKPKVEA